MEWQQSINEAYKLYDQKRYAEALGYFDLVENSNCSADAYFDLYNERGNCIQALDYHLDAIDDFTKLIELLPSNANAYFMRSMSYLMLGEVGGAWRDTETAIQLSKICSEENSKADKRARGMGYDTATLFYELRLQDVEQRAGMSETTRMHLAKPKIRRPQ